MITQKDITVGIKSFLRPKAISRTLERLKAFDFYSVVVADDAEINEEKELVYEEAYKDIHNFKLLRLPEDVGLSAGRNAIVDQCATEYLLMLDDDQELPENIMDLAKVLESDTNIGGVSAYWREFGKYKCTACNIIDKGPFVIQDKTGIRMERTSNGVEYVCADKVPNSTLFKVRCLQDYRWDEEFKIGKEHLDFYLAHKRLAKWKFAVVPGVVIEHYPKKTGIYSSRFRHNNQRLSYSESFFKEKWKKKHIINGLMLCPLSSSPRVAVNHAFIKLKIPLIILLGFNHLVDNRRNVLR